MCSRNYGNVLLGDVDAQVQTMLVDIGEVVLGLLGILVGHIEEDMVLTTLLHLVIDGACHHVTRG